MGLRMLMTRFAVPAAAKHTLMTADLSGLEPAHLTAVAAPGSAETPKLLWGALIIAALDGLSPRELARATEVGRVLDLSEAWVALMAHDAALFRHLQLKCDEDGIQLLVKTRIAALAL